MWGKAYALLERFFRSIVKTTTGKDEALYEIMEQFARAGKEQNQKREKGKKLKVETTFDGTRINPESSGSIGNLNSDNFTPEDFTYGILEGMTTELYRMYITIQEGTNIEVEHMIGSGNGLRKNSVLCEIIEEMFHNKLVLAACEEEAATGAAMSSLF